MVPAVNPGYYLAQLIVFPISVVLFGAFLYVLGIEIASHGYVLSARFVWLACLCVSSSFFCIMLLDPSSALGILPPQWRRCVGYVANSLLLNSAISTFYMYMVVLSARHMTKVSSLFTNVWIFSNALATSLNSLSGLIGGITDNAFWFGICATIVSSQEVVIAGIVNVSSHKMDALFRELELTLGANFGAQRRKLWIIRIIGTLLIIIDITNSILPDDSDFHYLSEPGPTPGLNYEEFDATPTIGQVLTIVAHAAMLYALQRPTGQPTAGIVSLDRASSNHGSRVSVLRV